MQQRESPRRFSGGGNIEIHTPKCSGISPASRRSGERQDYVSTRNAFSLGESMRSITQPTFTEHLRGARHSSRH